MKSLLIDNPRCGTCIGAKEILESKGIQFESLKYLENGLSEEILLMLPKVLKLDYPEMIRTKEEIYKTLGLADKKPSPSEWIQILKEHPVLLQRPIFIHNGKGIIARPSERVLEII